jgi:hypothetical protein
MDIKPVLVPKPSDWQNDLVFTIIPPVFKRCPMMWRYALGIPAAGTPDIIMWYTGDSEFNQAALNKLFSTWSQATAAASYYAPPVGVTRGKSLLDCLDLELDFDS